MYTGCYFHGCEKCEKDDDSPAKKRANAKKRKEDDIRNAYIHHYGFALEIKKECDWKRVSFFSIAVSIT